VRLLLAPRTVLMRGGPGNGGKVAATRPSTSAPPAADATARALAVAIKSRPRTETAIVREILRALPALGVMAWRNNTGATAGTYRGKRRLVRWGIVGGADIIGLTATGRFVAIEVKRLGETPTPAQRSFLQCVRDRGGVACVATSVEEVDRALWHSTALGAGEGL
jgi:hypothetical protein